MAETATSSSSSKLQHFPIAFFAMIMGTSGLSLAWQKAAVVLELPALVGQVLIILVACLFLAVSLGYVLKILRFPETSLKEFHHPIKISFFPAFSISLLLLSIATLHISADLSLYLWAIGCIMHLGFTLHVITQWIHHPKFQIQHSTPAWFIPVVGNILVPISGVEHGFYELSWFFFSIGLVYWIVLKTLIFNRVLFHDPLPEKLLPTLFILIAPPAVGFLSYTKLNGGEIDGFSRILFYSAMFLVLLLFTQIERFRRIPFFLSWWAYSFPLAAASIAIQTMYQASGSPFFGILSWISLVLVTLVISLLLFKTVKATLSGGVFKPD